MAALNKVMIIGNLGRDPEIRMAGQAKVANFSLAVTEKFNDRNGEKQEKTEWINVVVWGKLAEITEQYLKKGSSVYVEGKLETSTWDDKDGNKKYKTEVRCLSLQMLGGRMVDSNVGGGSEGYSNSRPTSDESSYTQNNEVEEDDLPF